MRIRTRDAVWSTTVRTTSADPSVQAMVATGLVGALTALFTAYLDGRLSATRDQFVDYCSKLLLARAAAH